MARAHRIFCRNFEEAIQETLRFIVKCLEAGGVPTRRGTYAEGDFIGATWVCQGAAHAVKSVRIYAPRTDREWVRLNEILDRTYGDWKYVIENFAFLMPRELLKKSKLARKILESFGILVKKVEAYA